MKKLLSIGMTVAILATACFTIGFYFYNSKQKPDDTIVIAGQLPNYSKEEMASTSPVIIKGVVSSIGEAKWNTPDGLEPKEIKFSDVIYHDVKIKVDKVLKGSPSEYVNVRVYEGEVPAGKTIRKVESEGEPQFNLNENVLIFLDNDDTAYSKSKEKDHLITRGMFQGKFSLKNGKAENRKETLTEQELTTTISSYKNNKWPDPIQPKSVEK
ncbi:hypothetical protein [Paenibacillus sp. GbtcB18]|uniref:hypothetical protein n=1 Tax=Paenibacillus sp. GbtcB18 TaxID=2824763 RepID=UPI001C2F0F77|nr:hypothetical protein [Paenibacillus sp. GbtcB18]